MASSAIERQTTEEVLREERDALAAWLGNLEARHTQGEARPERIRRLKKLIGKLDSRIRLVRDLGSGRERIPAQRRG